MKNSELKGTIVHVIPYLGNGGVENRIVSFINKTQNAPLKHERVTLESLCGKRLDFSYLMFLNVRLLYKLASGINKKFGTEYTLVLYMPESRYLLGILRYFLKPRIVIVLTSEYYKTYYGGVKNLLVYLDRVIFFKARIYAISSAVKRDSEALGIKVLDVIRNVVEMPVIQEQKKMKKRICIPGRLHPAKGHVQFLTQYRDIIRSKNLQIDILGSGDLRSEIEETIRLNDLDEYVTIREGLTRIQFLRELSKYSLVIVPSRREGLGNVVLEANYYEIPVLTTGAGGISELIAMGGVGYIYNNEEEFEAYITKYQEGSLGIGIRRLDEFFEMDKYLLRWQEIHESLHI